MASSECPGSIHRRLSSVMPANSFFENVQLHIQLPDLLIDGVLLRVGILARGLHAAEDVGNCSSACRFQFATRFGCTSKALAISAAVLTRRIAFTATLGF